MISFTNLFESIPPEEDLKKPLMVKKITAIKINKKPPISDPLDMADNKQVIADKCTKS